MNFKSLLLGAVVALSSLNANAQETKYEFKPHAFVQVQGGIQHTLGEAKFGDLLSPNVNVGVGYQFIPALGARLSVGGWQSKGGWTNMSQYTDKSYKYKYVAPQLDLMLNLTNLFGGFNPKRVVDVNLIAGGALNIGFDNDEAIALNNTLQNTSGYELEYLWDGSKLRPAGRFGLAVDFRLSDAVRLGIEGNANVLSDKYNSKKAGNADWYFNALVGLKINLGKSYNKIEPPVEPVVVEPAKPEVVAPVVKKPQELTINVFFTRAASKISAEENVKVQQMVAFLKANPDAKVTVTGYADVQTGNPRINQKYSQDRADVVTNALIEAGIDASRITKDAKGDKVQPFAENDKNRVTIAIAK